MEQMINKDLIKEFRMERSWSQDQLASVSGLSLRTVQRIENEGRCSFESKKALASAFEVSTSRLDINLDAMKSVNCNNRGRRFGFGGALLGLVGAYTGITASLVLGHISAGEAGLYYGSIGAFYGICCAIIGTSFNRYKTGVALKLARHP